MKPTIAIICLLCFISCATLPSPEEFCRRRDSAQGVEPKHYVWQRYGTWETCVALQEQDERISDMAVENYLRQNSMQNEIRQQQFKKQLGH